MEVSCDCALSFPILSDVERPLKLQVIVPVVILEF